MCINISYSIIDCCQGCDGYHLKAHFAGNWHEYNLNNNHDVKLRVALSSPLTGAYSPWRWGTHPAFITTDRCVQSWRKGTHPVSSHHHLQVFSTIILSWSSFATFPTSAYNNVFRFCCFFLQKKKRTALLKAARSRTTAAPPSHLFRDHLVVRMLRYRSPITNKLLQ